MNTRIITIVTALVLSAVSSAAWADSPDQRVDRGQYNRLINEVKRIDAEYAQIVNKGMEEARRGDGQASLETQAQIISLRNKRDRTMNRLMVIALRWGWEVPDFNAPVEGQAARVLTEKEQVFAAAGQILQNRFEKESQVIARSLVLPVISVSPRAQTEEPQS